MTSLSLIFSVIPFRGRFSSRDPTNELRESLIIISPTLANADRRLLSYGAMLLLNFLVIGKLGVLIFDGVKLSWKGLAF